MEHFDLSKEEARDEMDECFKSVYMIDEKCKKAEREQMRTYRFYGWETADIKDANGLTPRDYYDILVGVWCADTCAPRMRKDWSTDNPMLGQCSITAFLMQDFFGGKVYGILRPGGNYHCFNVVNGCVFDLTSEQFGDEVLDYGNCSEQFRETHFAKEEKRMRYEYLRKQLLDNHSLEVSVDSFYSKSNKEHLRRGVEALNAGKGVEHDIIEVDE